MATLYRPDGTAKEYPPPTDGFSYSLAELKAAIGGGHLEFLGLGDGRLMVFDEEGKLKGFPINEAATLLAQPRLGPGDYLVGDVLVCRVELVDRTREDDDVAQETGRQELGIPGLPAGGREPGCA